MGTVEFRRHERVLLIRSHIITYGFAAGSDITARLCAEIQSLWNEPATPIRIKGMAVRVFFQITGEWHPALQEMDVVSNTDPVLNFFRLEEKSPHRMSFVDAVGCNTGLFLLENLYEGSTTAAHEYGHSIGLRHPPQLDYRGKGVPGIMCPRGTLVDREFQYNPDAVAGDHQNGGTLHPRYRRVKPEDIMALRLDRLSKTQAFGILGDFSSVWHENA